MEGTMSRRNRPARRRTKVPWIIAAVAGLILVIALGTGGRRPGHVHPEPRTEVDLSYGVMPPSFFPANARVQGAYQIAQRISVVLDGVYCYCRCHETIGHRSLFQCFQSQHGSDCDICIGQAELAYRMNAEGRTLNEIRAAMDATWGP
jgi:hypothetical protein